jgi:hypothetical protein
MIPAIPPQLMEIITAFLKNDKAQRALILMLSGIIAFGLGYFSKHCPPKSVVCLAEETTIKNQNVQLAGKDALRVKQLRAQKDKLRISCDEEIEQAKLDISAANQFLECSDICALYPQCESQGRCQ